MPIKLKKTVSISAVTGNSVLFNGSNQYLSVANTGLFGSGSWTFECWINAPVGQTDKPIIEARNSAGGEGNSTGFTVTMITPTEIRLWCGSQRIRATANYVNQWLHIAVVKNNTTTTMYFNGVSVGTTTLGDMSDTSFIVGAGYYGEAYINAYGNFYTSNMRVVKGSAVYTSAFTPSTSPLTAIANTVLLTCQSPTIIDNSTNNFTITNNNTATVSSAVVPFTTSFSVFKLKKNNATPVAPYSVQFNGSNQYLSIPRILDNSTDVTIEAWVYTTSTPPSNAGYIVSQYVASAADRTIFAVGTDLKIVIQVGSAYVVSAAAITLNTWYHLAWVRSGSGANNFSIYINGVRDGQMTYTGTFQNTPTTIGGTNNLASTYFPGYISNLRILKGTALYTGASFTPPTTQLTAIANTSLLTCNAATIIDGSTNNFTITNNNTATVSSTITPFTASISTNKFKLRQVSYSPYMIATGGDLITTSGSYKIHTFTTVGTSSFVVSNIGNNLSVECLIVGGGGGGGGRAMAGGGGGGGVVYTSSAFLAIGSFSAIVGAGGIAATGMQASSGQNGESTSFTYNGITTTALGGGGGATEGYVGLNGANGGGGTNGNGAGGAGIGGGFPGGSGSAENYATRGCGGGGGGAGGAGVRGVQAIGGNGGVGAIYNITGSAYYGGGGGGGGNTNAGGATAGAGGLGGGGLGGRTSPGTAGTANTGGGGGGGGYTNTTGASETNGGNGGSGIILIKYRYTA